MEVNRRYVSRTINMRSFLLVVVSMLMTQGTQAAGLYRCGPGASPIECYVAVSKLAIMDCELESRKAVAEVELTELGLGARSYADMLSVTGNCVTVARKQIDPIYNAAAKHLAGNRDATNMLKDYHAFWIGTLDGLNPNSTETKNSYKRRIEERKSTLDDKSNRLLLEK